MPRKPTTPILTQAQKRAYEKAIADAETRVKLARGDADAIQAKARRAVMAAIDRAAEHTPATAGTTKQAKKGFRRS
jgi:hypothetical protein